MTMYERMYVFFCGKAMMITTSSAAIFDANENLLTILCSYSMNQSVVCVV
jgi:hypothetical protein